MLISTLQRQLIFGKRVGLDLPKTILIAKAEDGNDDDGSDHFDNLGEVSSLMPTPEFHQS